MLHRLFKRPAEVQITKDNADETPAADETSSVRETPLAPVLGRQVKQVPRRLPWSRLFKRRAEVQITKDEPEEPVSEADEQVRREALPEVEGRIIRDLPRRPNPVETKRVQLNTITLEIITQALSVDKTADISEILFDLANKYKKEIVKMHGTPHQRMEAVGSEAGPSTSAGPQATQVETLIDSIQEEHPEEVASDNAPSTAGVEAGSQTEGTATTEEPTVDHDHSDAEESHASGAGESQSSAEAGPSTPPLLFGGRYGPFIPLEPTIVKPEDLPNNFDFGAASGVPAEMPRAYRKGAKLYAYDGHWWKRVKSGNLKLLRTPERTMVLERDDGHKILEMKLTSMTEPKNATRAIEFEADGGNETLLAFALVVQEQAAFASAMRAEWQLAQEEMGE